MYTLHIHVSWVRIPPEATLIFHFSNASGVFLSFFLSTSPITSCICLGLVSVSLVVSLPWPSPNAYCQVSLFIQAYEMFDLDPAS